MPPTYKHFLGHITLNVELTTILTATSILTKENLVQQSSTSTKDDGYWISFLFKKKTRKAKRSSYQMLKLRHT